MGDGNRLAQVAQVEQIRALFVAGLKEIHPVPGTAWGEWLIDILEIADDIDKDGAVEMLNYLTEEIDRRLYTGDWYGGTSLDT